ncbi:MAG: branched-chain alpha-keto acid dehydrogenase subunit E2 [Acidobacteria bacterium]|nr:MAG: branched-chain alpha-keto acid dehydrogenase subunit E2 [Acidobacteriota bacterium]
MATEIKLPVLGENVDSGTVVKVLVSVGDTVTEDQPVLDLDTEKASVEVPASASGTVKEIRVKEGETVKVGQVLLTLEEGAETKEAKPKVKAEKAPGKPEAEKSLEKTAGEAQARAERERDNAKPQGTRAASNEEQEREKPEPVPPLEPIAEAKPEEKRPPRRQPDEAQARAERERDSAKPQGKRSASSEVVRFPKEESERLREVVPAAPSVRRMARELGIDINEVSGTGPDGHISEADVRNYARSIILNATARKIDVEPEAAELPEFSRWGEIERQPMTGVRRKTAEHLLEAWISIPHVTHFDSADVTELEQLRAGFAKKVEEAGGKLAITAIVLKIAGAALKVFPQFNASFDPAREEIIHKKYYNIGVAVDTDRGLLVPVIRDVDKKNILELSVELTQAAEKARNRKLTAEEMQGGTFTITNLGGIGGIGFTPIINAPEVAILGISRANQQPVFNDGQFSPRLILPLALSFDHRVIDGADAARFLRWVSEALQQPFMLTLEA